MISQFYRFLIVSIVLFSTPKLVSQTFKIQSPNKNIDVAINIDETISLSVSENENDSFKIKSISMLFNNKRAIGVNPKLKSHRITKGISSLKPIVPLKDSKIDSEYEQIQLDFKKAYQIIIRAYNDGIAYRFIDLKSSNQQVINENMVIELSHNGTAFFPEEESMYSHNERLYEHKKIDSIKNGEFCSLPVLFDNNNSKILFTETSLHNYPGMFLEKSNSNSFKSKFTKFVLEAKPNLENAPDRNQIITKEASYIAETSGNQEFPWRLFIVSHEDKTLIESNLVSVLSEPSILKNTNWIKPGKVAWDWYNANLLHGVNFESGINTETYKFYIDFASANHIDYVILDEGWTKSTTEIKSAHEKVNVQEIINYGKSKNVGIILWVLWKPLDVETEEILKIYSEWGAKGIKVDFMQRSDQYMVNSYEKIARISSKYKLLVDFHGAFKPSGIERKYPNVLSYEGVKGNENNKWSSEISPEHNVTIPFIRMAAGPMDFTPGSMLNNHKINHSISFERPQSLGTRCHQLAMYVIYESPLQMMCESPSIYLNEQESVDFISQIPTTWDETVVLEAKVSDYVVLARRKGNNWYIGGMTDWTEREFNIDLNFLGDGEYQMESFKDGVNAKRYAPDYQRVLSSVTKNNNLKLNLVSGGGFAAILKKVN